LPDSNSPRSLIDRSGKLTTTTILPIRSFWVVRASQRIDKLSADSVIVDGELRKAMMELPAFFQPDPNTRGPPSQDPKALVQYYEKIMLW